MTGKKEGAVAVGFEVEKGVPLPPRRGRKSKYPVGALKDGESFLVPNGSFKNSKSVVSSVYAAARRVGAKIATRVLAEGVRVWRVNGKK